MSKILYVLDPGHTKDYNKGVAPGYYEGNKMQILAAAQKKYLEQYGITAILTKESAKENPSLTARGKLAVTKGKGYDIVIFESLHTNAPGSGDREKIYGVKAIRSKYLPDSDPFITTLMNTVAETMKKGTGVTYVRNTGTRMGSDGKTDYYGVIRAAVQSATSVEKAAKGPVQYAFITEHGFHTNSAECAWLNDEKNLDLLAKNKAAKIAEWFGLASTDKDEEEDEILTSIMGAASCTAEQMAAYLLSVNPNAGVYATDIPKLFLEEGAVEGVRGDIAFAQSCHETGNFKFTGDVVPEQNNFAGIGTTGGGVKGAYFESPRLGVRAQIQHLKAYATKTLLKQECIDPRFGLVTRGIAPNVEDLGGRWAYPGYATSTYNSLIEAKEAKDSYGHKIVKILNKIAAIEVKEETIEEDSKQEGELYIVASACTKKSVYVDRVGAFRLLDNAIAKAKSENKKVFADSTGAQVYPEPEVKPVAKYYRVAKNFTNGKYVGQTGAFSVLVNAVKNCGEGLQVFSPDGEPLYPKFKNTKVEGNPGTIHIIKDGDFGEGVELHYTPEYGDANLDKVHGPAHLGNVYDVVGTVTYNDNTFYLLSNGSYITISTTYVKFTKKETKLTYTAGRYKTTDVMALREGPGTTYDRVDWNKMTASARKNNPDKGTGAYYRKGCTFYAYEVVNTDKTAWARTPSGWICIEGPNKNKQVKYCTPVK